MGEKPQEKRREPCKRRKQPLEKKCSSDTNVFPSSLLSQRRWVTALG